MYMYILWINAVVDQIAATVYQNKSSLIHGFVPRNSLCYTRRLKYRKCKSCNSITKLLTRCFAWDGVRNIMLMNISVALSVQL